MHACLLLSADIQLHYQLAPIELGTEVETVLALAVARSRYHIIFATRTHAT